MAKTRTAKKKTYEVEITYTITLTRTVEIDADDEETAESLAEKIVPEVGYRVEGWEADENVEVQIL